MNRLFKVSTLLVYAAITFTFTSCNDDDDNGGIDYNANVNKNIVTAANPELARLEFPKAKKRKEHHTEVLFRRYLRPKLLRGMGHGEEIATLVVLHDGGSSPLQL